MVMTNQTAQPKQSIPEPAPIPYENIVAKPLAQPGFGQLKSKNPNLSFRWINRLASDGLRVFQMESVGFRIATPVDVDIPGLPPKNNQFINGDLILMCLPRVDYLGALKYNALTAEQRLTRKARKKTIQAQLDDLMASLPQSAKDLRNKMSSFVATNKDLEGSGEPGDITTDS